MSQKLPVNDFKWIEDTSKIIEEFLKNYDENNDKCKNIFTCLFSVRNTISLSRHEQVCLMRLRFERYFSHHRAT